ncbi:MAG: hypothetical protein Q7R64_04295 [bacterium]|nr:hypothetical protein [bacterium]
MRASQVRGLKKKKERKNRIAVVQKAVLYALVAAGGLSMALVAPNALRVLEQFGWVKTKRPFRFTVSRSVERLEKARLVTVDKKGFITLTKIGEQRISEIERADYQLSIPEKWDGKWRVVSFDIKEKRKKVRELLRWTLQSVGFVHLHHSVWVYPHDCEDFLSLLKADYHIGVEILYIIAEYIENDDWLRRHFGLSGKKV